MRRFTQSTLLALVVVVVAAIAWNPARFASAESKHYGFVDLETVLDNYNKNAELTERLNKEFQAAADAVRKEEQAIQLLIEELEMLQPGGAKFAEREREIIVRKRGVEFDRESVRRQIDAKKAAGWRELYGDIVEACEKVAGTEGLDAVFAMSRQAPDGRTDEEMMAQITLRQVIYADSSLDVTAKVLEVLNG